MYRLITTSDLFNMLLMMLHLSDTVDPVQPICPLNQHLSVHSLLTPQHPRSRVNMDS